MKLCSPQHGGYAAAMLPRLRHRFALLRLLCLALVLCVLAQPVLVAASEVHEAAHLLQTGHDLGETHGNHGGIPADESPDARDAWHVLMHAAHCCGTPSALPQHGVMLHAGVLRVAPPRELDASVDPHRPARLLRPPIHG